MTDAWERKSWQEVRFRENDLGAMLFPDGWLTFRVLGIEHIPIVWTNFGAIAAGNAASPINTTAPIDRWLLTVNNQQSDIFWHEWANVLYQAFFGISHPLMQYFREYPLGTKQEGLQTNIGKYTLSNTAASQFGWRFYGAESPYSDPKAISMELLPYKTQYGGALFNYDSHAATPQVNVQIIKTLISPLDPADKSDASLIADILRRRVRATLWSPGIARWDWGNNFRKVYNVEPVTFKGKKVVAKLASGQCIDLEVG